MLAKELLTAYATEHDISPDAVAQLRYGIAAFARHLGRAATAKDFAPASVNAWLAAEVQRVSKRTARNYRASVLTLWRYAFDDGLTEQPPLRVRKIAAPLPPVEAYEPAEIEALLAACDKLPIKWRFLMRAYILVAWQTVFRFVDLLRYAAWLVELRHSPRPEPDGDPYEKLKERARARNVALAIAGRDIGDLPAVANSERKKQAASDFRFFCESYFPLTFHLPWSPDHLKVIGKIEQAVLRGGLFAMAMPRGSGKTTICECACIWAVLNGHRDFVCLIGSDEGHAMDMLDSIKMELDGTTNKDHYALRIL